MFSLDKFRNFFKEGQSDGHALAEFAIAFPFQIFLTFGLMQLMLLMISALVVNYASYRCARSALVSYNSAEEIIYDGNTISLEDYVRPVAQIILAPLAFSRTDQDKNLEVPGWGELGGSGAAAAKIKLKFSSKIDGSNELIATRLTFKQELIFPFIDKIFQLVLPSVDRTKGRNFAGASEADGGIEVLRTLRGTNRLHYVITRQHIMRRQREVDVRPGSEAYNYK